MINPAIEAAARAGREAECPGREGPFGGYDYGHNTEFYGPEPDGGRYVVRDFRDPSSPNYGAWVHQTPDEELHRKVYNELTDAHVARAAVIAFLRAYVPSENSIIGCATGDPRDVLEAIADELEASRES